MRRFLVTALAVLLVISFVGVTAGAALAKSGPYLPGDNLFMVQYYAEQQQIRWYSNPADRTGQYLLLLERRLANLAERTGSNYELDSLVYLEEALDQAILALIEVPDDAEAPFRERLLTLVILSEIAVQRLKTAAAQDSTSVAAFLAKLSTIQALTADSAVTFEDLLSALDGDLFQIDPVNLQENDPNEEELSLVDPVNVPFPANSPASEHEFFPLVGEHALLECEDCHSDGVYDGTPNWCEACHSQDVPANHYIGDCGTCHSPESWEAVNFDHSLMNTSTCLDCHADDEPANHYGTQCAACHNTNAWLPAVFDHKAAGAFDCVSCHFSDQPANHYDGQCSSCHTTGNWQQVSFNHTGQTDCKSCHSSDKPSGHYGGQCSSCHNTKNWRNASFNHSGQTDCKSCHSGDKPSGHFSGQCSSCHNTNDWDDANFNHSAQTDCIACHSKDRPREHSNKQCSQCHNQRDWDDAEGDEDEGGEKDGGDDDHEEEDDEHGSINRPLTDVFAGNTSAFDCGTCHGKDESPGKPGTTNKLASLWFDFLGIFRSKVDV